MLIKTRCLTVALIPNLVDKLAKCSAALISQNLEFFVNFLRKNRCPPSIHSRDLSIEIAKPEPLLIMSPAATHFYDHKPA